MTLVQFTLLQILLLPFFKNVNDIKLVYHTLAMVLLAIWSRVEINILQELSIFKKNLYPLSFLVLHYFVFPSLAYNYLYELIKYLDIYTY